MKKFAFLVLITAIVTNAQMPSSPKSKSDAQEDRIRSASWSKVCAKRNRTRLSNFAK
jgi:hypothetical protein